MWRFLDRLREPLDRNRWRRLSHAYGSAADLPDRLRALASDDPQVAEKALFDLNGALHRPSFTRRRGPGAPGRRRPVA
ncbi:hypothetical protein Tcur_0394 [Thermomonospora curvata DSM 43183]|uniref:Uncharacterized protein n=1 Tax=Thermomonospora curvata (strain ATCC 19995 / DSM 43183 / JCM 3096 / KCTC 9072 / NBRC 15933 / NCIMB 10081 / Henssen B9) TaxID=471852 RepID=D1A2H4_THECD|nr:hypothetical protein Tcur_0394 [Thermomonospora curvata DSM 43183]